MSCYMIIRRVRRGIAVFSSLANKFITPLLLLLLLRRVLCKLQAHRVDTVPLVFGVTEPFAFEDVAWNEKPGDR